MDQNKNKETEEEFDFSDIVKSEPTISNSGNEEFDFSDIVKTDSVKKKEPSESSLGPSASEAPSTLYPGNNDSVEFRPYKQKALRVIKKVPLPDNDAPENSVDKVVKEATPLFTSWANDPSLFDLAADKSRNDFYQKLLRERKVSVQEEGVIKDKLEDVFNNARQVMLVSKKLKENPADIDSRYSLAYHQNRMGNNKEALANYESIIASDKNYTNAYNGIAYVYGTSGNNLMAIDALDRGIENNPTDASLYLNRGTYKLRVKDDVSALKDYETAYKMAELSGDKNLMQEASLKRVQTWRNLERSQDKDVAQKYIDLLDNKDGQDDKTIDREYFKEQADAETENYLKLAKDNKKAAIEQEKHIRENILPKIQKGEPLTEQEQKMWESPSLASAELKGLERGLAIGEAMDELLKPLDYSAVVSHPIDSAKEYVGKAGETIEEGRLRARNGFEEIAQGAERSLVDPKEGFSQVGLGFLKSAAGLLESAGGIIMNFTPQGILFQKGVQLSGVALGGEEIVNQFLTPMNSLFKPKGEAGKLGAEVIDNILQDFLVFASGRGIKYAKDLIKKIKDKKGLTQKDVSTIVEAGSMLDDEAVYDIAEKNGLEVNLNKVEEAGGISDGTGASSAELINQKAYSIKESLKSIRPDLKEIIDEVPTDKVISDMNDRGMPISKSAMAKYFDKVKIGEINVKELSIEEKKRFDELSSMDPDFMTDEQFKELEELKIKKEPARVESERSVFDEPANPPIEKEPKSKSEKDNQLVDLNGEFTKEAKAIADEWIMNATIDEIRERAYDISNRKERIFTKYLGVDGYREYKKLERLVESSNVSPDKALEAENKLNELENKIPENEIANAYVKPEEYYDSNEWKRIINAIESTDLNVIKDIDNEGLFNRFGREITQGNILQNPEDAIIAKASYNELNRRGFSDKDILYNSILERAERGHNKEDLIELAKSNIKKIQNKSINYIYKYSDVPVEKRKMLDEVYEKPTIDFANELIDSGLFNSAGQILDWRADLSLSTAEITKGLNDIKKGVNSVPARKIIEAAKDIQDKGEINTIRGRGGNTVRSGIPLDEYFKAVKEKPMPEELKAMDIEKANNIKDHTASVINNEGINKDNFDTFVKENDWLYTPEEINRIKTYLDETTERERTGDAQSQTTPLESEPVGETKVQDEGQAIRERAKTAREELKAASNEWWNEQQKLGIIAGKKGAWESAKTDLRVLDATYKYAKAQIELGAYTVEKFIKDMHDEFKIVFTNKDAENIFNKIEGINDKTDNGAAAKLGIAKVMESTGVGSRKTFLATGWERGTDGSWNYELPDGDFKNIHNVVHLMLNPDGKDYNITDLFDAEDLYKAYPEIKNVNIKFIFDEKNKNEEAVYIKERASNKETIQINAAKFQTHFSKVGEGDILGRTNNLRGVRRLFTHELEHIVQDKEGFAKGGTPYNFDPELYKELAQKHDLLNKGLSEDQIKYELYRKLSGEVQARNAADRLDLTNEEKANRPFSDTQEIGPAEQILSFADAEAYSQATSPESYNKLLDHTVNSIKEAIKDSDNKELEKNKLIDNIRNTRLYKQLSGEPDFNESAFLADIEEKIGGEKLTFENAKTKADEHLDDSKESKKRKFIQTVLGSDKTTEELKGATKELDQFYEGVSNKESIAKADRDIKANITQAEKDVFEAKGLDANVAVKGIRLIKHHESLGNWEEAVKIVDHLTTMGKKAGQGIQAFTLWNKLSPETIVKMSDKMMNEVNKKDLPKEVKKTIFKKMSDISKMPEGVDKTEATMGVLNYLADQIPPTFKEKFDAFRYSNMLSNPLSHARNIHQGLFNTFLTRPLDMFAGSVYDYIKHPDNPSAREYQLADAPKHIVSALTNIPNAWISAKESFKKGYVADRILDVGEPKGMIQDFRRSKTLRKYSLPTRLMEWEDVFISTMLGQAEKTRLMDKGMSEKEANTKAKSLSEKFLYRNRALLNKEEMDVFSKGLENGAEAINKWRSRKDWVGYGTSWFVPFVMTPMRATQFALEFSPLGFAGGKFSKQKIARATLGSVAMGIGAMMAATDKTTWSAPEDKKERALFYDSGRRPYSVRIGDTWVPMQYFGPFGLSMAIPAAFKHHFKDSKEALNNNALDALGKATYGMGKYILETTPLANMGGMFKVLDGEVDYTLMNQLGFSAKQLFPYEGLIGYINKWKDKKYRKANGFFESLEKDIPFLSDDLDVYKTSDNKDAERGFESVLLPYATGANEPSMENKMIKRRKVVQQKAINNQSEK